MSMKKTATLLLLLHFFTNSFSSAPQWKLKYTVHARGAIAAHFLDIDTLVVAGGQIGFNSAVNVIMKFSNRGESLVAYQDFNDISEWFKDMSFPSHDTGYAIGWN